MSFLEEYILAKIEKFTLVVLVQGYMQMGKSTFVWYLMNCLSLKKFGKPWDFKKYCARSLDEFLDMIDKYDNSLIVYEEASKDISVDKFYDDLNYFFNIVMQTQAYKHNLIVLVFPHSLAISKRQRYFINLGLEITRRVDEQGIHATIIRPTIYKRNFWRLDEDDLKYKWWGRCYVKYTDKELEESKEYTEWLELMKQDTLTEIRARLKAKRRKEQRQEAYQTGKIEEVEKPEITEPILFKD